MRSRKKLRMQSDIRVAPAGDTDKTFVIKDITALFSNRYIYKYIYFLRSQFY